MILKFLNDTSNQTRVRFRSSSEFIRGGAGRVSDREDENYKTLFPDCATHRRPFGEHSLPDSQAARDVFASRANPSTCPQACCGGPEANPGQRAAARPTASTGHGTKATAETRSGRRHCCAS